MENINNIVNRLKKDTNNAVDMTYREKNVCKKKVQIIYIESLTGSDKISDFSDPKAEALGRSMLFKGADDVKHDVKALLENPQIAENSDEAFETAFKAAQDAGVENPYEEAASFATTSM